jgi:small GTP-binding protein
MNYNYIFKLLLIGDSGVGKSNILWRFTDENFNSSSISTIGIDFRIKTIEIDGKKVKLQIYDTAGQERFRSITQAYYRGAKGVIFVYDVGSEKSFDNVKIWMKEIASNCDDIKSILVGNKIDTIKKVSDDEVLRVSNEYGIDYIEASAKMNINIEKIFIEITKKIMESTTEVIITKNPVIFAKEEKKSWC